MELGSARRQSRVLLVEDDLGDAFLVRELLEEVAAPVELTVVPTIAEAKAQAARFDCVLLDLELPDASGLDALRQLLTSWPSAAVCVLTGLSEEHLGEAALAHGAQDYLVKGRVDGILLERAIRYAVERRRAEDGALLLREAKFRQAESSRLERGLLPHPLLDDAAIGLRSFYRAGRQMGVLGGDFYDVVQTGPQRVSVVVGDVCGHAAEEAALGVELRVAWRALTLAGVEDDQLHATLERILISERRAEEIFVTMATVTVDCGAGTCLVRTTGHPPPILITDAGARPLSMKQSIVLGLMPGAPSNATAIRLPTQPWGILAYTDGLIEARDGDDWLGTGGLCQLIDAYMGEGRDPDGLPAWLVAEAERRNGGPLADDVAMLLLSGDGSPPKQPAAGTRGAGASVADTPVASEVMASVASPAQPVPSRPQSTVPGR